MARCIYVMVFVGHQMSNWGILSRFLRRQNDLKAKICIKLSYFLTQPMSKIGWGYYFLGGTHIR